MLKILISTILFSVLGFAYAQKPSAYVQYVDNLALHIDTLQGQGNLIVDGIIEQRTKKWFHKKIKGGYAETYYYNRELKKLNKVFYETSLNNSASEEYYFFNDSLVMVKTIRKDNIIETFTIEKLYFRNNLVVNDDGKANASYFLRKAAWYISNFTPDILTPR